MPARILIDIVYFIIGQIIPIGSVFLVNFKTVTVEFIQAVRSAEPQITVVILKNRSNRTI